MHTEEDTFNRLRRTSFDSILQIVVPLCMVGENVAKKQRNWMFSDLTDGPRRISLQNSLRQMMK